MVRFLYWAVDKMTGKEVNFMDENFFDIGDEAFYKGGEVIILDMAVESTISCEELYEGYSFY